MAIAPAAKRPFADPKQLCRLHLAQLRPLRSTENIGKAHPSYPLVNACPIHPNPPSQEVQMTGHFTSYKTRPNHELATRPGGFLDPPPNPSQNCRKFIKARSPMALSRTTRVNVLIGNGHFL